MSSVTINTNADYTFDIQPEVKKVFRNIASTSGTYLTPTPSSAYVGGYYGNVLYFIYDYTNPTESKTYQLTNGNVFNYTYKDESKLQTVSNKHIVIKSGSNQYFYHTHNTLVEMTTGTLDPLVDFEVQYPYEETGLTVGNYTAFINDTNIRNEVIYVRKSANNVSPVRVKITFPNGCTILQEKNSSGTIVTKYYKNKSQIIQLYDSSNKSIGYGISYYIEKKVYNNVISDYEYVKEKVDECFGNYSSAKACFDAIVKKEYSPSYGKLFEYDVGVNVKDNLNNSSVNPTDSGYSICINGSLCIRVYDWDSVSESNTLNNKYIDEMVGRISERWFYPLMSRSSNSTTLDDKINIEMSVLTNNLANITIIDKNTFADRTNRLKQMKGVVAFPKLTTIKNYGMKDMFRGNEWLKSVKMPLLATLGNTAYAAYSMQNAFKDCYRLESVELDRLATVYGYGMQSCFENCRAMETISSADTWTESDGHSHTLNSLSSVGPYGMYRSFANCENIKGVLRLPLLSTVSDFGMYECFAGCKGLTEVFLPGVQEITASNLYRCFSGCNKIRKLHLKSDVKICIGTPVVYDGSGWVNWEPNKAGSQSAENWYDSEPTNPTKGDAYSPLNVPTEEQKTFSPTNTEYGYLQEFLYRYFGCKNAEILFDL